MFRRRGFRLVMCALAGVALAGCDWPMFGVGPEGTRFSPDTSISKAAVRGLVLDWTALTGADVFSSPVVANGVVYVSSDQLYAFDATGNTNCSGTLKSCTPLWTASATGPPSVVNGLVYAGASVFDAAGRTSCSGTPKTCRPLWTFSGFGSGPVVAKGLVYATSSTGRTLSVFDAAGRTNCSGSPKTCTPLWSGDLGVNFGGAPAVVGDGIVYVNLQGGEGQTFFEAFDAAGNRGCSGTPKTCVPLWTGSAHGSAVANGVLYGIAQTGDRSSPTELQAFDAAGSSNCSGNPKSCAPLWTAPAADGANPAVGNGVVYISTSQGTLDAFDAAGSSNCSGSPKVCTPLWTTTAIGNIFSAPAIANGVVYVGSQNGKLYAFDAAGNTNCSGTPKTCAPLSTVATAAPVVESSPTVSNGFVYIGSNDHKLYAFGLAKK